MGENGTEKQGHIKAAQGVPPFEYRWKPGQSGNPKGRPRKQPLTDALEELVLGGMISQKNGEAIPTSVALARVAIRQALQGDFRFYQELMNRIDGKVADRLAGHDGGPLNGTLANMSEDELVTMVERELALHRANLSKPDAR